MFAGQRPTRLPVIELGFGSGPTNQLVLAAVVFGVTASALLIGGGAVSADNPGVISPLFR